MQPHRMSPGKGVTRTRRSFLEAIARSAAGAAMAIRAPRPLFGEAPQVIRGRIGKARSRPDLVGEESPAGLEVMQLTTEPDVPGTHVYMEAQVFTPDSKRFILHRSATPHDSRKDDPRHQYLRCDLEDGCSLEPLTEEPGVTAPSVSPDGKVLYYFVDETSPGGGRLTLRRVNLDGGGRETILVLDRPLPGTRFRPSRLYPLSSISSDGGRLALSAFLGDGLTEGAPFGLMVFDLEKASVELILHGPSWGNLHAQYCRSTDPDARRDLLIQENHGSVCDAEGVMRTSFGGEGVDIHVIRDDGTRLRSMPWGRDGNEFLQGHQCWRGRTAWGITSTGTRRPQEAQLIEGRAASSDGHAGIKVSGGVRNDLSRSFGRPDFYHFGVDLAGKRLISDAGPQDRGGAIWLLDLDEPGRGPAKKVTWLLNPRSSWKTGAHIHPFLSPDGTMGFFNSDESGLLQAYLLRGLPPALT